MQRTIKLGNGKSIRLGTYVKAWKTCLELPPETWIGPGISGWGQTAAEALRDLRYGLHDRINRHDPAYYKGRKWNSDWQRETANAARALNTPRLAIHWLPIHLKKRFEHRISQNN